ncbi:NHL domain-containing protein [Paenibacillus sp. FSL K6-2862]|uniref:NHL domain-containing protein n=1 Tax=Paenibacillus sp. FSL K6-2862 TaxID=2921484 RepID=UPI0030F57784
MPEWSGKLAYAESSYTIHTVAGTSTSGYSGDGGPATLSSLNRPCGVALDSSGNLYITDTDNNRVRKVDTSGKISTIAGTGVAGYSGDEGPATSAALNKPCGLAVDSSGNLYISDYNNHRVRKVDMTGKISTIAGKGSTGFSGDGGPATSAELVFPEGLVLDHNGNLYIADYGNHRIRKVDETGKITTVAGREMYGFSGDGGDATSAQLFFPTGVALDDEGNLYIADTSNQRIRKVDSSGKITTVAGNDNGGFNGDGGAAVEAYLYNPTGVVIDGGGNLFIADSSNQRIRKVDSSGKITTIAGTDLMGYGGDGGPATSAELFTPQGIALDRSGDLYVADLYNSRIRELSLNVSARTVVAFAASSIPEVGTNNAITLTVKNAEGYTDTTFTGIHDVTISGYLQAPDSSYGSVEGTLLSAPSQKVSVTFVRGVAKFNVRLHKAKPQTISLSVADVASPAANPLIIHPVAGKAVTMTLTKDITSPDRNGGLFGQQPVITLRDTYGNTSSNDNSTTVTALKKDKGTWTLTGVKTVTAQAGVVTFTDLGATNDDLITGAQLSFETPGLSSIVSTAVTLPKPEYSGKLITRMWPVPHSWDHPEVDDKQQKFKLIDENVYLTNESYADVLFTTQGIDLANVSVDGVSRGSVLKDPLGNLSIIEGADSLGIDSTDPMMDIHALRFKSQPVVNTGSLIHVWARSNTKSESESISLIQAPKVISLNAPSKLETGKTITVEGSLDTKARLPISITTTQGNIHKYTDEQGHFSFTYTAPSFAVSEIIIIKAPGVEFDLINSWDLTIYEPLVIIGPDACNGTTGELFSCQLTASGGIGAPAWQIETGSLPDGIRLDPQTGLLSGIPTTPGKYTATIAVMDSAQEKRTKTIMMTIEPKVALSAPHGVKAEIGDGMVILSWEPVHGATYYDIYEGYTPGSYEKVARITDGSVHYSIKGLPNNMTRYYTVKAGNDKIESDYSEEVSATPKAPTTQAPEWPEGSELSISEITQTSVKLSWPSAMDHVEVSGYRIYVNGAENETVSGSVYAMTMDDLTADTSYMFQVMALNAEGNQSAALSASAKTLPQSPEPDIESPQWPDGSELEISNITSTSVKLSWPSAKDNIGVLGYKIYVDGLEKETVSSSVYGVNVGSLAAGTNYTFSITAYDAASNESSPLSKPAKTAPAPSTGSGGGSSSVCSGDEHVLSANADLRELEIGDKDKRLMPNPPFNPDTTRFTILTEADQVEIAIKPVHSAAKVMFEDEVMVDRIKVNLEEGDNQLVLIVLAENGSKKEYQLTIHREKPNQSGEIIQLTDLAGHWAEKDITRAAAKGLISGYPDRTFQPNNSVTRAEFTVMLTSALQLEAGSTELNFTDRDQISPWAKQATAQAVRAGLIEGYKDGGFRPNAHVTRTEMTVMIARALDLPMDASTTTGFADDQEIPKWAKGAVEVMREQGYISGRGGDTFAPNDTATRAEASVMLLRLLED